MGAHTGRSLRDAESVRPFVASGATLVLLALSGCMGLEGKLSRQFMKPAQVRLPSPSEAGLAFEDVHIEVDADVILHGWFLPSVAASGRTVLLFHGSQKDISYYFPYYRFLHDAGLNVFLYDYRGYGESGGEVSVAELIGDAETVLGHLTSREDVDPNQVAVYGISMGTIPALALARRYPKIVGAVVEDCASPDANIAAMLKRSGRGWFLRGLAACWLDLFVLPRGIEPDGNTRRYEGPVFFLHGEHDFDIDLRATLRAYREASGQSQLWILPGTGHAPDSLQVHDGEYQAAVRVFLAEAFAGKSPPVECAWDARGGHVQVTLSRAPGADAQAVELCVCLESGAFVYDRVWLRAERAEFEFAVEGEVVTVGAMPYRRAERDGQGWRPLQTPYSRARALRGEIETRSAEMLSSTDPGAAVRFARWIGALETGARFDPRLEAELTETWLGLGKRLLEEHPAEARRWLQRAVDSEPDQPGFHFWMQGGMNVRMGWTGGAASEEARTLLGPRATLSPVTRTTLITGASGFLGAHVVAAAVARSQREATLSEPLGPLVVAQSRGPSLLAPRFTTPREAAQWIECDLTEGLEALLERVQPTEIVHCAALSRVRDCEANPDGARAINAAVPARIAAWAAGHDARLVHVSTDLVFGLEDAPPGGFDEDATPGPVSEYGRSKLAGEHAVLEALPDATVVRLPLLYGNSAGRGLGASDSLLEAVERDARPPLFVDEWRTPLEVSNAAQALAEMLDFDAPGLVHVAGPRRVSRYDFGLAVLGAMGLARGEAAAQITGALRADVDGGAARPRDVSLDASKASAALEVELLDVRAGLERTL